MAISLSSSSNEASASALQSATEKRFGGSGIEVEKKKHAGGKHNHAYLTMIVPAQHLRSLSKWLKHEQNFDLCSLITGVHWPGKAPEQEWEVVYHLVRTTVRNPPVVKGTQTVGLRVDYNALPVEQTPLDVELRVLLPSGSPVVDTVQDIWPSANWNEKETWDLVGIEFSGHQNLHRVLLPIDTPIGYHPLQKQHKIRYHDFNEMYDDPQGFGRKPVDKDLVK